MLLVIATALAFMAQTLLALVVLLKDRRSLRNRAFFLLSLSLLCWAALTFAFDVFPGIAQNIEVVRLTMFFVVAQNCFFALFAYALTGMPVRVTKKVIAYTLLSVVTGALMLFTPFMFSELALNSRGAVYPVAQPGMGLFVLQATISITLGFRYLIHRLRRVVGSARQQMLFILFGSIVLWGVVPITNFILSITLQTTFYASFTPFYAFAFSALIAYAIVRHRLFDIRLAIARALAYVLVLVTLAILYASAMFGVIQVFFNEQQVSVAQNVVYVTMAVFLAFTFEPLRRFFSRLTNRIFFQDAYETKLVLDSMTSVLVRSVTVDHLVKQSLQILNQALKSEYAAVVILNPEQHNELQRTIVVGRKKFDIKSVLAELVRHSQPLLVLDEIENQTDLMYRVMQKGSVAVAARLETTKEQIGYLFFGYKESGNVYTSQDVELIRIATDELSVAIQNALRFEKIAHFNETLQDEVSEATNQLRQSNKKLQALDEAKDEFISMASHQLRTPLTSVKGYLSMALEGDGGNLKPEQRRLLEEAYASSQRMVYMIADFLNVSRLKTGKFILELSTLHLPQIIKEELEQLGPAARGRGLTLQAHISPQFPALKLDENKIRQVIMNFIDNAIFYSKSGGTIEISLIKEDKEAIFTVKDHGIGVPANEKMRIFTKFFRATNARHVRPDGTGIGLFMAKKVIAEHGGKLIFETEENKGSTFGFSLPLAKKLENPADSLDDKPDHH